MNLHEATQRIHKEGICITRDDYPKGTFVFGTNNIIIPKDITSCITSDSSINIQIDTCFFECDKNGFVGQFVPREIDKTSEWKEYKIK